MRILMVENHEVFARTVTQAFLASHTVRICPTLKAAKTALASNSFDALLVDYDLDDGKGNQLVAWVRSTNPEVLEATTESLVDGIRLRSGDLPDDVAVIVVRRLPDRAATER